MMSDDTDLTRLYEAVRKYVKRHMNPYNYPNARQEDIVQIMVMQLWSDGMTDTPVSGYILYWRFVDAVRVELGRRGRKTGGIDYAGKHSITIPISRHPLYGYLEKLRAKKGNYESTFDMTLEYLGDKYDPSYSYVEDIDARRSWDILLDLVDQLDERRREIIRGQLRGIPLSVLGERFGFCEARACQLGRDAVRSLRELLPPEMTRDDFCIDTNPVTHQNEGGDGGD